MTDEIWKRAEIESPCVKICVIHPEARLCVGCYRSIEEIGAWSRLSPEARQGIMAELPEGTADECADVLLKHCRNLLITGGHGPENELHNRLYLADGSRHTIIQQRLPGKYHGSGCTLASALAGRLALGEELGSAVRSALDYTWRTLRDAETPGRGQYIPRRFPIR